MRIISGLAKGKRLKTLKGMAVRPTSDKVRGAIFNILGMRHLVNANVLDLFSGTGALGIEALSRGASGAVFVEKDLRCVRIIRENLEKCGLSGKIIKGDVYKAINRLEKNNFNIVFADPPYGKKLAKNLLQQLHENSILKNFSFVVIEHSKRDVVEEIPVFHKTQEKRYGDTIISIYRYEKYNRNISGDI